jgi:hypothetical protein
MTGLVRLSYIAATCACGMGFLITTAIRLVLN